MIRAIIQPQDFDVGAELESLCAHGAVASFIGHVRADDGVATLFLESHPTMTQAALDALTATAMTRWPLAAVTVIHRIGTLTSGERIVLVAAASAHREAALVATAFVIDRLKTDVPLWKKEVMADGRSRWVEPRPGDAERSEMWA